MDRYLRFVLVGACVHLALFILAYIFVGLDYTLLLFILWGAGWIMYCGAVADGWDKLDEAYDDEVSIPALALIGGPLCWILCPTCLVPSVQRKASGFSFPWHMALRLGQQIRRSLLKSMSVLHGFCARKFPSTEEQPDVNESAE